MVQHNDRRRQGDDTLSGWGDDTINGGESPTRSTATSGRTPDGGAANDTLNAGDGFWSNTLLGGAGNDTLNDGRGSDFFDGGPGADSFNVGDVFINGTDTVDYSSRTATVIATEDGLANDGEVGEGDNIAYGCSPSMGAAAATRSRCQARSTELHGNDGNDV